MNAVEIQEAIEELVQQPYEPNAFSAAAVCGMWMIVFLLVSSTSEMLSRYTPL